MKQLAKEFARAGADVTQTFTFYSTDDWVGGQLEPRISCISDCILWQVGTFEEDDAPKLTCKQINSAACKIAKEVSEEYGTIVCGGITQTETYVTTK